MFKSPKTFLCILILFLLFPEISKSQTSDSISNQSDSLAIDSTKTITEVIEYKIGDISDGNKSVPVHLIKLYDYNGFSIHKNDEFKIPFSIKNTCGDCHTYDLIKSGTHFSIDTKDSTARSSEPYLYMNYRSLTLLPLSYRGSGGTISPDSVGMAPFQFLKYFGSHITGGNITENEEKETEENFFRWQVSGKLEINCFVCHDADPEYDQAEFANQINHENYKWASAASTSLANVIGYSSKMPDNYDPYNSYTYVDVDRRSYPEPQINYDEERFDNENKVFFDLKKDVDNESCLFCHTTTDNTTTDRFINEQKDVHIAAGMKCVDCHKNDINHKIIEGYQNEYADKNNEHLKSFSCEGCHIQAEESSLAGRYGAPNPLHEGIPAIHFDKLSCAVCHSSFIPEEETKMVKTSRAHKLGVPGPNKMPFTFPLIQSPVYVKNESGKIEPHNLVWPSYWARKLGEKVSPLESSFVKANIQPLLKLDTVSNYGEWPEISEEILRRTLDTLNLKSSDDEKIVFISGGKIFQLNAENSLESESSEFANPYTWPIAHNVRPAQQSLGVKGCDDCHSLNSDFYSSEVKVISSINNQSVSKIEMTEFEGLNKYYQSIFSFSFYFRPFLKLVLLFSTFTIILVVFSFILSGTKSVATYFHNLSEQQNEVEK
ncbi:MAG: cytochrome c3 family protein [Melioribacteraceae bacterium]|nr:cytochrome c3 family protein [Melioribacteraceae bacterium]